MKFLLWALLIYLAWRWYETSKARSSAAEAEQPAADAGAEASAGVEKMVACAQCGIHLPQSEALRAGALHYCCDAHRLSHSGH